MNRVIPLLPIALLLPLACTATTAVPPEEPRGGSGGVEFVGWGGHAPGGSGGSGGSGGCADCVCTPGDRRWCRRGDTGEEQRGVGACFDGAQLCMDGKAWSECSGGVGPSEEPAACDGVDQDCDGEVDEVVACADPPGPEICANGIDDDGDGERDDPELCSETCLGAEPDGPMACCFDEEPPPGSPCARLGCEGRVAQPCYSGPPGTLGVGICRGGAASCFTGDDGVQRWGACEGQVRPRLEICGDLVDDDCDGLIDEDDGVTHRRCAPRCRPGTEVCNGVDDDCDGFVDELCPAEGSQPCFAGPPELRGVGACRDGVQHAVGGWWALCDSAGPGPEVCGDGIDSDCNGRGGPGAEEDYGCGGAPADEVCNGLDDDHDGLVDEGVVNACGECGGDGECYSMEFHEPASCLEGNGRLCDRIVPDENLPDWFTLSTDKRGGGGTNVMYLPVPGKAEVAKLDTITGQRVWQARSWVSEPRYIAVPLDNSVWVGGDAVAHLDRDGNLICRAQVGASAGLAIDSWGEVASVTPDGVLFRISGTGVGAPDGEGAPTCDVFELSPGDPGSKGLDLDVQPDGLVATEDDVVWTGSSPAVRLDLSTMALEKVEHLAPEGIAIDGSGNPWFGGAALHRISASGPYVDREVYETVTSTAAALPSVDEQGFVWGTDGTLLVRVDPVRLTPVSYEMPAEAGATAPDDALKIWAIGSTGLAHRFDPINLTWDDFDVDPGQQMAARGDFTGAALRQFVSRQGSWMQPVDGGYSTTHWRLLRWGQLVPEGTRVQVTAQFADTRDALAIAPRCGPLPSSPADLSLCPGGGRGRWLAITIRLRSARDGRKPSAGDVSVTWTRP